MKIKFAVMRSPRRRDENAKEIERFDNYEQAEAFIVNKVDAPSDMLGDADSFFIRKLFTSGK